MSKILRIVVAGFLGMVLGTAWYMAFGEIWARSAGIEMNPEGPALASMGGELLRCMLYAWGIDALIRKLRINTIGEALRVGMIVEVGIIAAALLAPVIWAGKNPVTFLIDVGCIFVVTQVTFTTLFLWRGAKVESAA